MLLDTPNSMRMRHASESIEGTGGPTVQPSHAEDVASAYHGCVRVLDPRTLLGFLRPCARRSNDLRPERVRSTLIRTGLVDSATTVVPEVDADLRLRDGAQHPATIPPMQGIPPKPEVRLHAVVGCQALDIRSAEEDGA